jgi:hypothetical protein
VTSILRKLMCFIGFHNHIQMIDQEYTELLKAIWPFEIEPTPCTYLECKYCGHNYESRTIGFQSIPKEDK